MFTPTDKKMSNEVQLNFILRGNDKQLGQAISIEVKLSFKTLNPCLLNASLFRKVFNMQHLL